MPEQQRLTKQDNDKPENMPLAFFACPNSDCADFNRFNANNLSIAEWMGKNKAIRRLYCKTCGTRFSERQGSLMQYTKLPTKAVVRIVKCLAHGCSVEATADICEVDTRTVQRLLETAGKRAADFHCLQLENLDQPLEAVQMDTKTEVNLLRSPRSSARVWLKKGQNMAPYGFGSKKQVSSRIYHWPSYPRYGPAIDRLGSDLFQRQGPSDYSYRRPFAVPSSHPSGFWPDQTPPSQKRQRQTQASRPQAAGGFASGRGEEDSRRPRQFAESIDQGTVRQKETDRKAHSKAGYRPQDQHLSYGTTQRHDKRATSSLDKTYSSWFSFGADAAIFYLVVARFVQLDKGSLLAVGRNTCDGIVSYERGLDCFEICFVSGSCQRPSASGLGRAA